MVSGELSKVKTNEVWEISLIILLKTKGEGGTCKMEKRPEFIRQGTEGGPKDRRPGDWDCGRCGNMNYARRDSCNKCEVGVFGQKI